VTVVAPTKA